MFRSCLVLCFAIVYTSVVAQETAPQDVLLNEAVIDGLKAENGEGVPKLMPQDLSSEGEALDDELGVQELVITTAGDVANNIDSPLKTPEVIVKSVTVERPATESTDAITRSTLVRWFTGFVTNQVEQTLCPRRVDRVFNNVPLFAFGGLSLGDVTLRIDVDSCSVHVRPAIGSEEEDETFSAPFRVEVCPAWDTVILMNVLVPFNTNSLLHLSSRTYRLVADVRERFAFELCGTFASARRRSTTPERVCLVDLDISEFRLRQRPREIRLIDTVTNVNVCSGCLANPPTLCDLVCSVALGAIERAVARIFEELQERAFERELPVCRSLVA